MFWRKFKMKSIMQTIGQYLKLCEHQKNLNENTIKSYRIDLRQFVEFSIEQKTMFDRNSIRTYVVRLNQQYKPRTVKRKIASLKAFCTYLHEEELIPENPFTKLRIKLQEPFTLPRTIPLDVLKRMFAAAYQEFRESKTEQSRKNSLKDVAVMELLFATGMRVSELCRLNMRDINLLDGRIKIHGKGAKERMLQLTNSEVIAILRQYVAELRPAENDAFFLNQRKTRLSEQSVRLMLRKYANQIGTLLHITPHMFRHSFATLLLEEDVDIRYIQQLLGHSSIVTTQIYTHVATAKQRDILIQKHPRNKISI